MGGSWPGEVCTEGVGALGSRSDWRAEVWCRGVEAGSADAMGGEGGRTRGSRLARQLT